MVVILSQNNMKYIFLDTNIFIHYKSYEQIPWQDIVKDSYRLIVAPIVLDELDKNKTNTNKKIAHRVKNILSKIERQYSCHNACLEVYLSTPKESTFKKYNLSKEHSDHVLLSSILEFGKSNGLNNIVFVSHDTGARLRARQLNISVLELDENYLLPKEKSAEEKELVRLKKELLELKHILPNLRLTFNQECSFKEVELTPDIQSKEEYIAEELNNIKNKYPPFIISGSDNNPLTNIMSRDLISSWSRLSSINDIYQPTVEEKEKYNKELEKFYLKHEDIAETKYKWKRILSYAIILNLDLSNIGTTPAHDIDIFLLFPNSTKILFYKDFPKLRQPVAPYKPKYKGDIDISGIKTILNPLNPPPIEYIYIMRRPMEKNSIKCCNVEKLSDGSFKLHYKYPNSIKHNLNLPLETIWVITKSNFKVKYKLLVANYPKPIEGELNVNVTVKRQ